MSDKLYYSDCCYAEECEGYNRDTGICSRCKEHTEFSDEDTFDPYCNVCGGCGFIGCCGIASFLKEHVVGKTNCKNESGFVFEILEIVNDTLNETMQLTSEEMQEIAGVKIIKGEEE